MGRGRSYTTDEHAELACMWADGATVAQMADAVGRTRKAVRKYVEAHRPDFPQRRVYVTTDEHAEMAALRVRGWSCGRIAAHMGIPKATVTRHVRGCACAR